MRRWIRAIVFFICAGALAACDDQLVFEQNVEIAGATWSAANPARFEFQIDDTVGLHTMYVNLRHGEGYPYSNIFMFVDMEFPNGKHNTDTLECTLADATGKWLGSGLGDIYDSRFIYKQRNSFPLSGRYEVSIHYAMRPPQMTEIYDIGFRLERSK